MPIKGFIKGFSEVSTNAQQGIPSSYLEKLLVVAREKNTILITRPVEPLAKQLLEAGYPTKGFRIKGKSTNWGPAAGFIPNDQRYSKIVGNTAKVTKYNAQVAECISEGYAVSQVLILSKARINTLISFGLITIKSSSADEKDLILEATDPTGAKHEFIASEKAADEYTISLNDDEQTPFLVLAHPILKQPFTADIDLLSVCPRISDFGVADKTLLPETTYEKFRERRAAYRKTTSTFTIGKMLEDKDFFYSAEDPEKGNVSKRIKSIIDSINTTVARGPHLDLVHHNADETSPASDMGSNFPATVFLPSPIVVSNSKGESILIENICMVPDKESLLVILKAILNAGFHAKRNPLWGSEFSKLRSTAFSFARGELERFLSERMELDSPSSVRSEPVGFTASKPASGAGAGSGEDSADLQPPRPIYRSRRSSLPSYAFFCPSATKRKAIEEEELAPTKAHTLG